jgi:hypothetical protein
VFKAITYAFIAGWMNLSGNSVLAGKYKFFLLKKEDHKKIIGPKIPHRCYYPEWQPFCQAKGMVLSLSIRAAQRKPQSQCNPLARKQWRDTNPND